MKLKYCPYACFVVLIFHFQSAKSQTARSIVDQYTNLASGGKIENWNSVKTVIMEGNSMWSQNESFTPTFEDSKKTRWKFFRSWPDKSKRVLYRDTIVDTQFLGVNGKYFFVIGKGPITPINPGPYEPYFEFDPIFVRNVIQKSKSAKLLGRKEMDSGECFEIEVKTKELYWLFYFNTTTHLLDYWGNSQEENVITLTRVYNYKKIENFLIPMSELKIKDKKIFFSSDIEKIELNAPIDDGEFTIKR